METFPRLPPTLTRAPSATVKLPWPPGRLAGEYMSPPRYNRPVLTHVERDPDCETPETKASPEAPLECSYKSISILKITAVCYRQAPISIVTNGKPSCHRPPRSIPRNAERTGCIVFKTYENATRVGNAPAVAEAVPLASGPELLLLRLAPISTPDLGPEVCVQVPALTGPMAARVSVAHSLGT